jgi:hypothetical protein
MIGRWVRSGSFAALRELGDRRRLVALDRRFEFAFWHARDPERRFVLAFRLASVRGCLRSGRDGTVPCTSRRHVLISGGPNLLEQLAGAPDRASLDAVAHLAQPVALRHPRLVGERFGLVRPLLTLVDAGAFRQRDARGLTEARETSVLDIEIYGNGNHARYLRALHSRRRHARRQRRLGAPLLGLALLLAFALGRVISVEIGCGCCRLAGKSPRSGGVSTQFRGRGRRDPDRHRPLHAERRFLLDSRPGGIRFWPRERT